MTLLALQAESLHLLSPSRQLLGLPKWCIGSLPANAGDAGDTGSIPGSERSLEWEMARDSSILAWDIPWIEEPGGLQSIGL